MQSSQLTGIFIVIILGLLFWGLIKQSSLRSSLGGQLTALLSKLKTLDFERVNDRSQLNAVDEIFLETTASSSEGFRLAWHEFKEALSFRAISGALVVRNTEQAIAFFKLPKLEKNWNNQNAGAIGGTLMTLGILGTFLGLTLGLSDFEMGATDQVRASIERLIGGMRTSFITSVVGIASGIFYNLSLRGNRSTISHQFEDFISRMDHLFQRQTSEEIQDAILKATENQAGIMAGMAEDFANSLDKAFQQHLVPSLDNVNQTLASFSETTLRCQSDAMDSMVGEFLAKLQENLESGFAKMAEHLSTSVEKAEAFGESLQSSQQSLAAMTEKQAQLQERTTLLVEKVESVLENSTGHLEKMSEVNANLDEIANGFQASAKEVTAQLDRLGHLSSDFMETSQNLQSSTQAMNELWEHHRTTVSESLGQLDDGIRGYTQQTTENLTLSLSQFEDNLNEGVNLFKNASTALSDNLGELEEFFRQIHEKVVAWDHVEEDYDEGDLVVE